MIARLRLWWHKERKPLEVAVIIALALGLIALVIVFIVGSILHWDWTGLNSYTSPPHPQDSDFQRGKTLWDWMQLLIIPVVLAVGVYWLNQIQKDREQRATNQRAETEREAAEQRAETEREAAKQRAETERGIAQDNQREAALQAYIDKMSELMLERNLRESAEGDKVQSIARVRTLTVLSRLDVERKGTVLKFLHESNLIEEGKGIIDLDGADLSEAKLGEANLHGANMSGAVLNRAELYRAHLHKANLGGAYLNGAHLRGAYLDGAHLRGAHLNSADLWKVDLRKADLHNALLHEADLHDADLTGADLTGADLYRADLHRDHLAGANLCEANLREADLRDADLSDADLTGANLNRTDLTGAKVTQEQLDKAKSLDFTLMPDGSKHPHK